MTMALVLYLAQEFLTTALLISLPALAASMIVGLFISILQTITSVQDQTLNFVPRLLVVGAVVLISLAWTLQVSVHFTMRMIMVVPEAIR